MTAIANILIVDDDRATRIMLTRYLGNEGYAVHEAKGAKEMREQIRERATDLIILDWLLPDGDGLTLAAEQRRINQDIGIIMLTGKNDPVDKVVGLEMGADDYLVKPVDLRELLARVRSVLRRRKATVSQAAPQNISNKPKEALFYNWRMDLVRRTLTAPNGENVALTGQEFRFLEELIFNAPQVTSRKQLLNVLFGRFYDGQTRSVDVIIGKLRKKLKTTHQDPQIIQTIRGIGYQLAEEVVFKY